ncbi:hypothetical protein [Roseibium sp. RKSG952]|uniref:hypothetical protein n=1 Tax=Roseibium sp. RKSG952 TaxID=2529384 RepID=UPI0012BD09C3|nr:hypothetical protein [Roseibium sp. RKSG952]MTH94652.1 hypothetical protein [Roseibium sp. RKSG952]
MSCSTKNKARLEKAVPARIGNGLGECPTQEHSLNDQRLDANRLLSSTSSLDILCLKSFSMGVLCYYGVIEAIEINNIEERKDRYIQQCIVDADAGVGLEQAENGCIIRYYMEIENLMLTNHLKVD